MAFNLTTKSDAMRVMGRTLYSYFKPELFDKVKNGEFFVEPDFKSNTIKLTKPAYAKFIRTETAQTGDIAKTGKARVVFEIPGHVTRTGRQAKLTIAETGIKVKDASALSKAASGVKKNYSAAEKTKMQEIASMWVIRRAIKDNVKYTSWADIEGDRKFPELLKIYPLLLDDDDKTIKDWRATFVAQNQKMLEVAAQSKYKEFKHYSRDGGFMDFISDLVKAKFKISQKDTWNPADIWLVENQRQVQKIIEDSVEGPLPTIDELNATMRQLWKQGRLIGISLKLVSGKVARWEPTNITGDLYQGGNAFNFTLEKVKCVLSVNETDSKIRGAEPGQFSNKEGRLFIDEDKKPAFEWQIKSNAGAGTMSNLKYEPTQVTARKARLGKAPVKKVGGLFTHYKMDFENNYNNFPSTLEEYKKVKTKFEKYFSILVKNRVDTDGVTTVKQFNQNVTSSFRNDQLGVTTCKLMTVQFIAGLYTLTKKKRHEILTDMLFHALKKGYDYGPFGKLY